MKKIFFLCIIIASSTHIFFAMENYVERITQTVWDKMDPTLILLELQKEGMSKDPREKMTQMHRLDRVIPYYMGREETENLCSKLNQIIANKWPLSSLALNMAADYLWKKRPAIVKDKPLLKQINSTLDIIDPTQIIRDIEQGQLLYHEKPIDIENRVCYALEQLMQLKKTDDLKKLIVILTTPESKLAVKPGERILGLIYQYLRLQEKESKKYKNKFLNAFPKIEKSNSDNEAEKKESEKKEAEQQDPDKK